MNAAAELQAACQHRRIQSWNYGDGEPAGMWSCMDCGHKFVPLNIEQEQDAKRYQWLREFADWEMESDHDGEDSAMTLHFHCEWVDEPELDQAIDAEMKRVEYTS